MTAPEPPYMLATGEAAAQRLRLIDCIFSSSTRELLISSGLRIGWRVADIGCGVGLVSSWIAERVGSNGSVAAVDASAAQIEAAANYAAQQGLINIRFHTANVYDTGLQHASFDLVFSRFLMCHVPEPTRAMSEMRLLLKAGGVLVCEDYDQKSVASEPPSRCYMRLNEISSAMDSVFGVDSNIGPKLPRLFQEVGFIDPHVTMQEIVCLRGEEKRFWEITLQEARPAILQHGVAAADELDEVCAEMRGIAKDETIRVMLARVTQVWARKE
jgi:ubiquinone/menaquinone biosynthesis C-methylase UbiE